MTQGPGKGKGRPRERRVQGVSFGAASGRRNVGAVVPYIAPFSFALSYCFGLRILKDTYTGPLVRLRRSGDDAEKDFFTVNGIIDSAAIASWLGGADGFVRTWYDQSGSGRDVIHATDANQPKYIASHNGRPAVLWDGVDDFLRATGLDLAQPLEVSWVWQTSTQLAKYFFDSADGAKRCACTTQAGGVAGHLLVFAGASLLSGVDVTDADTHYTGAQFNGVASVLRHDGAELSTGDAGAQNMNGITLGARNNDIANLDGHLYELIVSSGGLFSGGQRSALESDQAAFYGVP